MLCNHDYVTALVQLQKVIERTPEQAEAMRYWLAYAEYKIGHAAAALGILEELRKHHLDSP